MRAHVEAEEFYGVYAEDGFLRVHLEVALVQSLEDLL